MKSKYRFAFVTCGVVALGAAAYISISPAAARGRGGEIQRAQVEEAQRAWCDALVRIGRVGAEGGDAKALANRVLSSAYAYDGGSVLFKPTLAYGAQTFRMTKDGALAYFVGGDPKFPEDSGFALRQWVKCESVIAGVVASGDMAVAMGNVHLQDAKGNKVTVDKTFGYRRAADGSLRIVVHHSSLPYSPQAK